jgi:methionine-rich copper-binding protein CopC
MQTRTAALAALAAIFLGCLDFSEPLSTHCAKTEGAACVADADCCEGYRCTLGQCVGPVGLPATPEGLTASEVRSTSVRLSWTAVEGALGGYTLRYRQSTAALADGQSTPVARDATTTVVEGLTPESTYFFTIEAVNAKGLSSPSSPWLRVDLPPPDLSAPTVVQTAPGEGAVQVPRETDLSIEFSEPMDRATVQLVVTPASLLGPPTWSEEDTVVSFLEVAQLALDTQYSVQVGGKDLSGNPLSTYSFSFRTVPPPDTTPPTLTSTTPANNSQTAPQDGDLVLQFSEPIDIGTLTVSISPTADLGDAAWNEDSSQATFTPPAGLAPETTYTVSVEAADLVGLPLNPSPTTFTFKTADVTPPTVVATAPQASATGVPNTTNISIAFSEPMLETDTANALTVSQGATPVTGGKSWDVSKQLLTFAPTIPLQFNTPYTVRVAGGAGTNKAQDLAGNRLAADHVFTFTTAAAPDTTKPTVASSVPANGATGELRTTNISVTFSEAMDKASAQTAFSITSPTGYNAGVFTWNAAGTTMTFNPDNDFPAGTLVSWRVSTAAKDLAGNTMAADALRSFRTAYVTTKTIYGVASLDGYIYKTSTATNVYTGTTSLFAGDTSTRATYRGFLTFTLNDLATTVLRINSALLYFNQSSRVGSPFTIGALQVESVVYGASLQSTSWDVATRTGCNTTNIKGCGTCSFTTCYMRWALADQTSWSANVTTALRADLVNRTAQGSRSQFRLKFAADTNNDSVSDYLGVYAGDYTTASLRPRLVVEYEHP